MKKKHKTLLMKNALDFLPSSFFRIAPKKFFFFVSHFASTTLTLVHYVYGYKSPDSSACYLQWIDFQPF